LLFAACPSKRTCGDRGEHCDAAPPTKAMTLSGHKVEKRRPPKRPPHILHSIVALSPSIDVPRTIPIGLTDAPLHSVAGRTAIPASPSATIIVVIVPMVVRITDAEVEGLCLHRSDRPNCRGTDEAQRQSSFC